MKMKRLVRYLTCKPFFMPGLNFDVVWITRFGRRFVELSESDVPLLVVADVARLRGCLGRMVSLECCLNSGESSYGVVNFDGYPIW
ncbi:hypothetical protein SAMN06265222_12011 [Neorhodopirellula lusitana]|uniref:Uncharacterized protein n=1 Tax=Neorhodopirellula lusitana TaxID=445327 RepID=A0ABY1QN63_9BACT|nr:hypothetical protein SAMN06265222_12011 [Neorhodopirellula lusitana]